jgi:hypothetical protein
MLVTPDFSKSLVVQTNASETRVGATLSQLQEGDFVIKLEFSGFMVLSRQLGTLKKTRLNHDDASDLQVIALERGPSSRLTILRWIFASRSSFFPEFPVVLNSLKSDIPVPS